MAGTLCQKRVSSCGWNMVSEEGQWVSLQYGVRRVSIAADGTWW